jgi:hypothetical protein
MALAGSVQPVERKLEEEAMWEQAKQALDQSLARLLSQSASLVPGLLALIMAVVTSIVVAWAIGGILRWTLNAIHFDQRLADWGWPSLAEWSPAHSPALLVSRVASAFVLLIGFLIGVSALDVTLTYDLVHNMVEYMPNLMGAALVLLIGTVLARFLSRSVLIGAVNINLQYARLISVGVKWMVLVLAVAMTLDHLKIAPGIVQLAFGILFGGIVFALALAVGLGAKELVSRSLEREAERTPTETVEEPFRHL